MGLRAMDDWSNALKSLKQSLALTDKLKDHSGDVEVLGDIGDIYAEIGDYERAGKVTSGLFWSTIEYCFAVL